MNRPLLSIIVPTKNRYQYLKYFIQLFCSFDNEDMELVIQDNSDQNQEIVSYLNHLNHPNLVYHYYPESIPISLNCDKAIQNSSGHYVCMMGDDDLLSPQLYDFVRYLKKYGYQSASFDGADYSWPGVVHVAHKFPNLVLRKQKPALIPVDVSRERNVVLQSGAVTLEHLPKVYHGVVQRDCMDQVFSKTGSYFPGPSPDMANAIALSFVVDRHVHCTLPYISSGASPKSTSGLGANHKHTGSLKDRPFLPRDIEEHWSSKLPMVWTGQTIWAQSAIQALEAMGHQDLIEQISWNKTYARFYMFNPIYRDLFHTFQKTAPDYAPAPFHKAQCHIFMVRAIIYIRNLLITRLGCTALTWDQLPNICEAEEKLDQILVKINIKNLFNGIRSDG